MVIHFDLQIPALSGKEGDSIFDPDFNFTDELVGLGLIVSLILAGFSKTKQEDEYTALLRLKSLVTAMYLSAAMFVLALLFIYGFNFLTALLYVFYFPFIAQVVIFEIKRKKSWRTSWKYTVQKQTTPKKT